MMKGERGKSRKRRRDGEITGNTLVAAKEISAEIINT
jgi:hypothetical protein